MKPLFCLSLVFLATSVFAGNQNIKCAKSGAYFYFVDIDLETTGSKVSSAVVNFKGADLTPGLYPSQNYGDSTLGGLKVIKKNGSVIFLGSSWNSAYDDGYLWTVAIPSSILNKSAKKGGLKVIVNSVEERNTSATEAIANFEDGFELSECWSVVK